MRLQHFNIGASPVEEIQAGAQRYSRQHGLYVPQHEDYGNVAMTTRSSRVIADAYDRMPSYDKAAEPAYKAMAEETGRQFDHLTGPRSKGGMGLDVEVSKQDPYGTHDVHDIVNELKDDIGNHNRIKVLSTETTGGHPYFTNDQNDMFRAVHDVFGHLGSGRGIDMHGEDAAYQKHSRMFSPLARQAMATETRGQNAGLHKYGDFQEQKVSLLPTVMQTAQFGQQGTFEDRLNAVRDARQENHVQGIA